MSEFERRGLKLRLAPGWHRFFGPEGYPFSLDLVELRDDTDGQAAFLVSQLPVAPARVFDLGSGNGRHARRLAEAGYEVTGFDQFPLNDSTGSAYRSVQAELGRLPAIESSTDACICMYSSAGYGAFSLSRQLMEWSRVTRKGGILLIDVANPRNRLRIGRDRIKGGRGWMFSIRLCGRRLQLNLTVVRGVITIYAFNYPEPRPRVLIRKLAKAGWAAANLFGDFDGSPWYRSSPRTIVKATRC